MTIPAWAKDYIGIPFKDHGRGRDGVDCWGLVRLVYRERFDIDLPSYAEAYRSASDRAGNARLIAGEKEPWIDVLRGTEKIGDVVLLRTGRAACHVGVVIGAGEMLHIEKGIDSCRETYRGFEWKDRIAGFYRFVGESEAAR